MRNFYNSLIIILFLTSFSSIHAQCPNGDLEMNNFTNWKLYSGEYTNTLYQISRMKPGFVTNSHEIVPRNPLDDFGNFRRTGDGEFALKLGSSIGRSGEEGKSQMASYTFIVTENNKYFKFQYAIVMVDYDHKKSEQPFFRYYITKDSKKAPNLLSTKQRKLYNNSHNEIIADKNNTFFKTSEKKWSFSPIIYKDWTCEKIDLSKYIGETVTINFISSDCKPGPDWGYVYIDALCEENKTIPNINILDTVCKESDIIMDASGTENEDSYFVSIQESDASGSRIGNEVKQWFIAEKAGKIDLKKIMTNKNENFKCNTYYRIKIATTNKCSGWEETTKLIYVSCPVIDLGPDETLCCSTNFPTYLTFNVNTYDNFYKYKQPYTNNNTPIAYIGNNQFRVPPPTQTTSYTVTAINQYGCTKTSTKTIHIKTPFYVEIEENQNDFCGGDNNCKHTLKTKIYTKENCNSDNYILSNDVYEYKWNTNETTNIINVDKNSNFYEVEVNDKCNSNYAIKRNIKSNGNITGNFPDIITHDAVVLNSSIPINRVLTFHAYNKDRFEENAYNANKYQIVVYNRWGMVVNIKTVCKEDGFENGEIFWDGKTFSGKFVPNGYYVVKLYLWNCDNIKTEINRYRIPKCYDWKYSILGKKYCPERYQSTTETEVEYKSARGVTVYR